MKSEVKVGVFDSGIGGLTVLYECVKRAPQCTFYYYGDNLNAPYGEKSRGEITSLVRGALEELRRAGVVAAVLACNTATAVCAEEMRAEFPFPVVGMEPAVKPAGERCKNVLVLATPQTARSERLRLLMAHFPACRFTVFPAKNLAGAVEKKFLFGAPLTLAEHLPKGNFDGVVLGCTHYVYLKREIASFYGGIPVFDGGAGTANRLVSILSSQGLGTADHLSPCICDENFVNNGKKEVQFIGKCGKLNEKLYKSKQTF